MSLTILFVYAALLVIIGFDVWAWRQDNVPTITQVTRAFMEKHGMAANAVMLAVGILLGHLFWCGR